MMYDNTFIKRPEDLFEKYERWNEDERDDDIIMHTDCLDDFRWWLDDYLREEDEKNKSLIGTTFHIVYPAPHHTTPTKYGVWTESNDDTKKPGFIAWLKRFCEW